MCGISGIFDFNGKRVDKFLLEEMNRITRHRGPDGNGVFAEGNVGLASNRLAIIDLREISNMPLYDTESRYVIVFNGEIFNYIEVRNELLQKGHKFKTDSDTEVIVNAYKEWGEECLHKLNGMWAFAIWDKKEKTLFCSRDRYGIKPFYYYKDTNRLIFASEIKQILYCGVDKSVNDEIIYDYLIFHFIDHNEQTFFKHILKLQAGYKLTIKNGKMTAARWYNLPENNNMTDTRNLYSDFYNLLYDSVRLRLRSDVEVGSCLSGGLDSSAIVCTMHDILHNEGKPEIQKTYTACYDDPLIDERPFVEEVIKQTNSTKYYLFPDVKTFLNDLDSLTYHQDEPYTGATVFAQWCVFKKIHETGIKVVLDGQGSDEILLGYFSFFPFHLKRNMLNPLKFITEFAKGVSTTQLGLNKFTQNFIYFNTGFVRYRHVMSSSRSFINQSFVSSHNRKDVFNEMIATSGLQSNRLSNLWNISLPSLLRYEDKNSMAFSVEARLPFLDHRLVEFIFSIPLNKLIHKGWTKHVLRESLKGKIPEDIRMRKGKLAFSVPQKKWMNEISDYLIETFSNDFRAGKYIDKNRIIKIIKSGNYNDKFIYRAFALEKWMKVFDLNQ
ncbi:MAG: asparagine synthase (glutamine-hydrolyzing) [Chlorobi bacterium]|nr:asparagine synthase (glutamine-hydrolyzing) [Chlorobiota bacterium]MCI0716834.1 asparagine synthase (glutamine-hydrolyzing) [Chlorobiota bacterium]